LGLPFKCFCLYHNPKQFVKSCVGKEICGMFKKKDEIIIKPKEAVKKIKTCPYCNKPVENRTEHIKNSHFEKIQIKDEILNYICPSCEKYFAFNRFFFHFDLCKTKNTKRKLCPYCNEMVLKPEWKFHIKDEHKDYSIVGLS